MIKLKQALAFGGILSDNDITRVSCFFQPKKLKALEHFQMLDTRANTIAFVESGIFRYYTIDNDGNDVTKYFIRENQFMVDLESYYSDTLSVEAIQAMVPCEIYTIKKSEMNALMEEIPNLFIFQKSTTEAQLLNKIKDNDFLNFGNSKTKYLEFMKRYPKLAQQVPQQYIASYLKITPQSLSRLRKNI